MLSKDIMGQYYVMVKPDQEKHFQCQDLQIILNREESFPEQFNKYSTQ